MMITHDREVAEHAQRVLVLRDGLIVEDRAIVEPRDAEAELDAPPAKEADDARALAWRTR